MIHELRRRAGGEQIEIAARLTAPPEAPDRLDGGVRSALAKIFDERGSRIAGVGQQMPSGKPFLFLERLENEAFLFRPHALHRADTAIPGGRLEIVQRAD